MGDLSDAELLALFRQEEQRHYAFQLIVRQYQRRLYAFVRRMVPDHDEAADVLQEAFIKAWNALPAFRGEAQLYSWLYRIAHNESLNHIRRKHRRRFVSSDAAIERLSAGLDASAHLSGNAIERMLHEAILRLPPKQRAVFHMKYFEELTYEQISAITGTSVGALKSSYHFAVKKIEARLALDQTRHAASASKPTQSDEARS